ncbi:aminopeptidase C [[Mycoplasma] anseris]|nr:C1 family peptidase [[Mycoplasma] anseris]
MKLELDLIKSFEKKFNRDKTSQAVKNAIAKVGINQATFNNDVLRVHNFEFSNEVKTGSMTNQKSSGRCWIFAALNMARVKALENLKIKDIEFSQNYIYFWEKMEKANTFLENIINYALDLEPNDRLFKEFMNNPVSDGGYWEWYLELNKKYGVCPKQAMPETFHSSSSNDFCEVLNLIVKQAAAEMRRLHKAKVAKKAILEIKEQALYDVYNVCVKALGMPPKKFDFEYRDADEKFQKLSNMTPQNFYEKVIGDEILNKISLVSDPREIYPYGKLLKSKYFKTVIEGNSNLCLNVPLDELKRATIAALKDNKTCWFACDVSQFIDRKSGILDADLYSWNDALVKLDKLSKKEKFELGVIYPNHAMNFVGVDLDKKGNPIKWKVENSWGSDIGSKGIFSMSDKWFDEYMFESIVDKKYVDPKYLKGLEEEPIEIEPWDPIA